MKRIVILAVLVFGLCSAYAQAPKFDPDKAKQRTAGLLQKVQDAGFTMTDAEKDAIIAATVEQQAASAKCKETFATDEEGRKACAKEASKARTAKLVSILGEERAKQFGETVKSVTPKRPAAPKPEAAPAPAPATE